MNLFILLSALLIVNVECYPNGAPTTVCTTMMPFHPASPQQSSPPYRISLSSSTYTTGRQINGSIEAISQANFRGFILQVRRAGSQDRTGQLILRNSNDAKLLNCPGSFAITHTNRNDKRRIDFAWLPSQNVGDIEFVMTIVRDYNTYWTMVKSNRLSFIVNQPCNPNPCSNGQCFQSGNSYSCSCFSGWQGRNCDQRINNRCSPNPCVQGQCFDTGNGYRCQCFSGYTGTNCDRRIDYCNPNPCVRGTCNRLSNTFSCTCPSGYTGTRCEIRTPCSPNPCRNGGACSSNNGEFSCSCPSGWTGETCTVRNVDLCQSFNPCGSFGRCQEVSRESRIIRCICNSGYYGNNCQLRLQSACARRNPCDPTGGTCVDVDQTTVVCRCRSGYKGNTCSQRIGTPCQEWGNSCGNGRCENVGSSNLRCVCNNNWFHRYGQVTCNTSNACEAFAPGQPCINGRCFASGARAVCQCNSGWTGDRCQFRS